MNCGTLGVLAHGFDSEFVNDDCRDDFHRGETDVAVAGVVLVSLELLRPSCPIPRCDIRRPGASRSLWVWRRVDLDAFLASRLVRPGETNPQDFQ
jgi:hypothetical protein